MVAANWRGCESAVSFDAEHLVRAAVIVMMRIDPVLPGARPTIAIEQRHTARRGIAAESSAAGRNQSG